eukprot:TRINITY_DN3897_c0_g1_i5.p1 TRINITY_DN3897_c0_g1~~TRINITY_DN3897_c0_g1_i5.p1  ORF type:complete len:402 (-),score=66.58 TRINITY_DN3897_c0_g1_i5:622-1827(-)
MTLLWLAVLAIGLLWLYFELKTRQYAKRYVNPETGKRMFVYCAWNAPLAFLKQRFFSERSEREQILDQLEWLPDIYLKWYGSELKVVVCNPETIMNVVSHKTCDKPFMHLPDGVHTKRVLGDSLALAPDRGNGRKLRRVMNPAFKYAKLNSLIPTFVSKTEEMLEIWESESRRLGESSRLDLSTHFKNITFDIIGKTAFGYDFRCLQQETTERNNLETFFRGIMVRDRSPEAREKLNNASKESEKLVSSIITNRKNDMSERFEKDLLDHILAADDRCELTEAEIMHNMNLFFLAGQETSAGTMVSAMWFLSTRPEVQEKLYKEVKLALGDNNPTPENIASLAYLDCILKETLRMNIPVVTFSHREAVEDMLLDGHFIPKGVCTSLCISLSSPFSMLIFNLL